MKKEILDERILCNGIVQHGDTIDTVINTLEFFRAQIKPYHTRHEFEIDYDDKYLKLYRLETELEYTNRIEYEKLKEKYG